MTNREKRLSKTNSVRYIDRCRLLAFSVVAREYNYVKPNMVTRQIIAIEQGRHPLLEFLTTFVPNDTYSGDGKSLVKVLTGPNASGKSTYMKQVALIIFMAHIGCYVPAKSAIIGIMTHILTQITHTDSVALNTSMFLQDIRQVQICLLIFRGIKLTLSIVSKLISSDYFLRILDKFCSIRVHTKFRRYFGRIR